MSIGENIKTIYSFLTAFLPD